MSFAIVPVEVKEQIFAHLSMETKMNLRFCSRIDKHVVDISNKYVSKMTVDSSRVSLQSGNDVQIIQPKYEGTTVEEWNFLFREHLESFVGTVANRLYVKKIVLRDANEATLQFIRQLRWDRMENIDIAPSGPDDMIKFLTVIGNREFNLHLDSNNDFGDFSSIEQIYETTCLKSASISDDDMDKFKNLRRFESEASDDLTPSGLKTFLKRWIEMDEEKYYYFYLQTRCSYYFDDMSDLDILLEGLIHSRHWLNEDNSILHIAKNDSEVGRLKFTIMEDGTSELHFLVNEHLKLETDEDFSF